MKNTRVENLKIKIAQAILFLTICYLPLAICLAEVPRTLNFQAKLTDPDGNPLTGSQNLTFTIFAEEAAQPIWEEAHTGGNAVIFTDGICNVTLGLLNPLTLAFDKAYYLSVSVNNQVALDKQPLSASAYALNSERLGGVSYIKFLRVDNNGNVGIGTTNPQAPLQIMAVGTAGNQHTLLTLSSTTAQRPLLQFSEGAGAGINSGMSIEYYGYNLSGASNNLRINNISGSPVVTFTSGGNVGIGTSVPSQALDVVGNITSSGTITSTGAITSGSNLAVNGGSITTTQPTANLLNTTTTTLNIGGAATSLNLGAANGLTTINNALTVKKAATVTNGLTVGSGTDNLSVNTNHLYLQGSSGNVGIGTATPVAKLDVKGSAVIQGPYLMIPIIAGNPSSVKKGMIWFDSNTSTFKCSVQDGQVKRFMVQ